jgi:hypothetical protein
MPADIPKDYYLAQRPMLLKNHRKLIAIGLDLMRSRYGEECTAAIVEEAHAEFERLIPQIPYIGGSANSLTDTLVQMTSLLALYRVLKRHGRPVEEIGELVYQMAETWVKQYPRFVRMLIGRFYMSQFWRRRTHRRADVSQQGQYPGDFVYEVVEGDGETFDWGVNYLECGVVKFFHEQDADEFTPYMCLIDYLMFPGMGVGLRRQGTIAHGCTHCDFRFKRGGSTPAAWPPAFPGIPKAQDTA